MSPILWKAVAAGIVAFWLLMSGQLVRVLIYPEKTRLSEVPAAFVIGLFLGRAEPSQLVVLRGGKRVGEVSIGTRELTSGGVEAAGEGAGRAGAQVNIAGMVRIDESMLEIGEVAGRVILNLDAAYSLRDGELRLRVPGSLRGFELEFQVDPLELRYRLTEQGRVMRDSGPMYESNLRQVKMFLALWGVDLDAALAGGGGGGGEAGNDPLSDVVARRGQIRLRGERFHGYVVDVGGPDGRGLVLVFSEAGELMNLRTFLDYELLAEVFLPPEASDD